MNKFVIDINQLRKNVKNIKFHMPDTKFCAMVKANAYGHGIKIVSKNIEDLVDYFGVACVFEGVILRKLHIQKPIIVCGALDFKTIKKAVLHNLELTITSLYELNMVKKVAKKCPNVIKIHIKINTGMNRYGTNSLCEFKKMLQIIWQNQFIKLQGIYSHISKASDKASTTKQNHKFLKFAKLCPTAIKHLTSSAAALNYDNLHYDMIRIGIAMYGYSQYTQPCLAVFSTVCDIKQLNKGEYIGYENSFAAKNKMTIAVVPLGYADGINLKLSNRGCVYVNNQKANIVGRICMDCFMIDITGLNVELGDKVEVLSQNITAQTYADMCETIPYEILTNLNSSRMKTIIQK